MKHITQAELPWHICDRIDNAPLAHLFQEGKGKRKKVLVIGESPALNGWILSGKAFYTKDGKLVPSGKRLNELFARFGFTLEDVSFTELCKCILGSERKLLASCAPKCRNHLLQQIEECAPKLIIILGKHTLDLLNGIAHGDIPMAVLSRQVLHSNEYSFLTLYHPSPINPKSKALNEAIMNTYASSLETLFLSL